jgi:hypothetical protein
MQGGDCYRLIHAVLYYSSAPKNVKIKLYSTIILPILCIGETGILMEKNIFTMFDSRILRKMLVFWV